MAEGVGEIVEPVPMPPEVQAKLLAFFEAFHVERKFEKRKRDRADPEALAHRAQGARERARMSENFLSRWTRRKRAVRAAALAERAAPAVSDAAPLPEPEAEGAEADLIAPQTGPEARPPEPEPADDPVLDLPPSKP